MKIIGLDIGTTNIKALVINQDGKIIDQISTKLEVIAKKGGHREQEVEILFNKTIKILKTLLTKYPEINTFVPSTTMHSLMLVDKNFKPLTNLMIWSDTRSFKILDNFFDQSSKKNIHQQTGVPIHPMSWIGKILWIQKHQELLWKQAKYLISFKEYLVFKLFNQLKVDYGIAASSGLVNQKTLTWDLALLTKLKIKPSMLSEIAKPTKKFTKLSLTYQKYFKRQLIMILGSSDGCLANLGSGVINDSQIAISIGTSSAARTTVNKFGIDQNNQIFSYPLFQNYYVIGGASNNGGNILDWYCTNFRNHLSYQAFFQEFQKSPVGANGLIFLPYLNGERAPYWNSKARGNFLNLEVISNQNDFSRSVLEGITFAIASIVQILQKQKLKKQEIILSGGIIEEPLWIQLLADVLNLPIKIINTAQTVALGAAYLGFLALKVFDQIEEIKNWITSIKTYYPNQLNSQVYAEKLIDFKKYYQRLYVDTKKEKHGN